MNNRWTHERTVWVFINVRVCILCEILFGEMEMNWENEIVCIILSIEQLLCEGGYNLLKESIVACYVGSEKFTWAHIGSN